MKAWCLVLGLLAGFPLFADDEIREADSPDGIFHAETQRVPNPGASFVAYRDADQFRLVITSKKAARVAWTPLIWNCRYALVVNELEWSPDSRFLVITTTSSGGHSPWHFPTFVFWRKDQSVRDMDDAAGLVTTDEIAFTGPHTVKLLFFDAGSNAPRVVDLAKMAPKMTIEASEQR